ncbi:MAG: NUDIX domain-containing protein [Fimbriimonadaceae bacterium]|nr:NUDIX domain-containing protein [Chitinophagales bacterium]
MFNIRVYGLLIKSNHVLITDEEVKGNMITKFPGGGLEFGEGTIDCLLREFKEELNLEIKITKHLYTTDFFVQSIFKENEQVISIYYLAEEIHPVNTLQSFPYIHENKQNFYWVKLNALDAEKFFFPIDRELIRRIKENIISL